jgi:hypothetical protein
MSTTALEPIGLDETQWDDLLTLLSACTREQLDRVRGVVTEAIANSTPVEKEKKMAAKTDVQPELFPEKSTALAVEIWNLMKGPSDPAAEELPEETLSKITMFAKEIRNRTLEEIAAAVDRAYSKFTETVVTDIRKRKE